MQQRLFFCPRKFVDERISEIHGGLCDFAFDVDVFYINYPKAIFEILHLVAKRMIRPKYLEKPLFLCSVCTFCPVTAQ